ncbi:uncharacterized protein EV422DRAFT_530458 [Fimicolochytrium jonesii]|uniref:uncharacterized protein n=1 Tax=Fimicolochytrium jonesii TaxID=1396493 RepID=UPI0022FEEA62|nr:uncharacterized protein EV422DRAFT_530458 [Fimicolochytrium jonesii]KAI8820849.1 hypothetical protein EV422DRAFT_530458 [Fimicolochytrium jonesii]
MSSPSLALSPALTSHVCIPGLSALLAETPLNSDQKDLTNSIRDCSDGLLIIVNDVLDFSKIEAGKLELETRPFDLFNCIESSLYLLHLKASQKGLVLTHNIMPETPKCVTGDVTRLRQILINLVGNSVKFTAEGQVVVTVSASPHPTLPNNYELSFEVLDTGIGIPQESIPGLFQSFTQVDSSTTRKYGGTGLGLAICKQLVEMMGGRIWVTSEHGKGSRFCFTIAASAAKESKKKASVAEAVVSDLAQRYPMSVLMAEDNAVNIKLAVRMLSRLGYEIKVVVNGAEAVEEVKRGNYDLVLMDMQMPVMNGLEATRLIRAEKSIEMQPVIIALTANAMDTDRKKCMEAGMDHHLSKPIKMEVLADALEFWGAKIATRKYVHIHNHRLSSLSMGSNNTSGDGRSNQSSSPIKDMTALQKDILGSGRLGRGSSSTSSFPQGGINVSAGPTNSSGGGNAAGGLSGFWTLGRNRRSSTSVGPNTAASQSAHAGLQLAISTQQLLAPDAARRRSRPVDTAPAVAETSPDGSTTGVNTATGSKGFLGYGRRSSAGASPSPPPPSASDAPPPPSAAQNRPSSVSLDRHPPPLATPAMEQVRPNQQLLVPQLHPAAAALASPQVGADTNTGVTSDDVPTP